MTNRASHLTIKALNEMQDSVFIAVKSFRKQSETRLRIETVLGFRTFCGKPVIPYASSRVMQLLISCSVDQDIWMEDIIPHSLGARTAWTINRCQHLCIENGNFARTCQHAQKNLGNTLSNVRWESFTYQYVQNPHICHADHSAKHDFESSRYETRAKTW